MLQYEPMTEEQIDKLGLLPKGEYSFRIIGADDVISQKSGKPQIKAMMRIKDNDGGVRAIPVYLGTNGQFMLRILRHFCRSTGLMKEYEEKNVCADTVIGAEGVVSLDIEEGGLMTDGSNRKFNDKNIVVDFIGDKGELLVSKELINKANELNDDISF